MPSELLSSPYAIAAAVGSLISRSTLMPASCAASFVAWRCASSKYAGTVMTAPNSSSSKLSSARKRSVARISALTSMGVLRPAMVSTTAMPFSSTTVYGSLSASATCARVRPISRLTELTVFAGSLTCAASASKPIWRPEPPCAGSR
ncbi:hypothetical protein Y695_04711 [Hydrogenophaga sp. T4]|nr:hypothetical protein Y695_04711 [Hydrogenophaga sp. T4]